MAKRKPKLQPTWTDVKGKLADFDRAALLGLIQSLYAAHKENQTFLHARFGLAEDVLEPYKKTIDRWLWPDVFRRQDTSVSQAKRAISDYKKAVGDPEGLAELMVFYCERAAGFSSDIASDDEGYFNALVRMFEQALKIANALSVERRDNLLVRLDSVRVISHRIWLWRRRRHGFPSFEGHAEEPVSQFCCDLAAGRGLGRLGRIRGIGSLCGQSEWLIVGMVSALSESYFQSPRLTASFPASLD